MEKKIKKIIVACDCSDYSAHIFSYAAEVAQGIGAELIIINVINQIDLDRLEKALGIYSAFNLDEYIATQKKDRNKLIQKLIQKTEQPDLFKKIDFKIGIPFRELITAVKEEEADLIIIGNKGRGNLTGVLLGSCAEKLYRRCPVSLLSVRVNKESRQP